jgi:predicted Zn-dependent peptidase
MTMAMLTKGTKNYSAEELAEKIEYNALTLAGSASMDVSQVAATCLSDKVDLATELLAEVVLRPTFPQDELRLLQEQRAASLSVSEQDIDYIVDRELRRTLFGDHPYSRNVDGELSDVGKLNRSGLVSYWKTYVRPDAAVLYFAGDVEPESVFTIAEKHLGKWKARGAAPDVKLADIPKPDKLRIYLVDKPGAVQSQIRVGQASITRNDPRYHLARFFTQIYGGAFDSRLNRVIRVERGLTYGAGGGFRPGRFMGQFISSTFTKTETTADTVQALLDVVKSMRTEPPTDDEMESARAYLTGSFPGDLETPQQAADFQWIIDSYGLPKDYLRQAMDAYKRAGRDDVRHIAEDVIDLDRLIIVVAGDAGKTKEGLKKIAPVTVIPPPNAPAKEQQPVGLKSAA